VDRPVRERLRESIVDEAMPLDEREPVKTPARNDHLKVVTGARPVDDGDLGRVRERVPQQRLQVLHELSVARGVRKLGHSGGGRVASAHPVCWRSRVLWSLAYVVVRRLFQLMVLCCRSPRSKELEILVLRHELSILRRQGPPPRPRVRTPTSDAGWAR